MNHTAPPRIEESPRLDRDTKYPEIIQNGLTVEPAKTPWSPNFVVSPSGYVSPIPSGATGSHETWNKDGSMYREGSGGHVFNGAIRPKVFRILQNATR